MAAFTFAHSAFPSAGPYSRAPINASASGANAIVAGAPGRTIVVLGYVFVAAGAVEVTWESGGGSLLSGPMSVGANGGVSLAYNEKGHFWTLPGESLVMDLSGAVVVGGHLLYSTF